MVKLSEVAGIPRKDALSVLDALRNNTTSSSSSSSSSAPPSSSSSSTTTTTSSSTATSSTSVLGGRRSVPEQKSGYALLMEERTQVPIITFSAEMDRMLGGGVSVGKVTEFSGTPGIGKTQLGMQLAVDVQIPEAYGGLGGTVVYIDTEGSFVVERVVEMAEALLAHLDAVAGSSRTELGPHGLSLESILEGITYYRVHSYVEQIALINLLPSLIPASTRLVVIDSVAFHFRHDFANMGIRSRVLNGMAQALTNLAESRTLAVVMMNQVTTRGIGRSGGGKAYLAPALGEAWGHAAALRINLYWDGQTRVADLVKAVGVERSKIVYDVVQAGVRDVADGVAEVGQKRGREGGSSVEHPPVKKR